MDSFRVKIKIKFRRRSVLGLGLRLRFERKFDRTDTCRAKCMARRKGEDEELGTRTRVKSEGYG